VTLRRSRFERAFKTRNKNKMTAVTVEPVLTVEKKSFRTVWLITAGHALTHWYPATFYLLLPLIGRELGLSYSQIGSILTVQASAGAIANVLGGLVIDQVARKGLLMGLCLFWVGGPYFLMGLSHEYWTLLTCAALVGIGNNVWHPTAIPLLAQRYPERKGLVVSIHGMGGNMGDALAPLAAGALLTVLSWREVMIVNVLPGILMSCVLLLSLGGLRGRESGKPKRRMADVLRDFGRLLSNRTLIFLSASSIFRSMTQSSLMTFLPIFLASQMGYSPALIGACMAGLQCAGFAAAPVAGHLSDRMGRRQIVMSSMATSGAVLLGMAVAGNSPWFVLFVAVLGFFLFAVRAVMQAWLLDATPPGMGGSSIGTLFAIQSLGSATGPVTSGFLADHFGLMAVFYFLACTIVVANLFVFLTPIGIQHRYATSGEQRSSD
jgi:FSR family fosmidomycin resistance protein-like MFS transporter